MLIANAVVAVLVSLSFLLPLSLGPLPTFHLEWLAASSWLAVAVSYFLQGGILRKGVSPNLRLALLLPGSLLALALLDLVLGRSAYAGTTILYMLYMLAVLATIWLGWQVCSALRPAETALPLSRLAASRTCAVILGALLLAAVLNACAALAQYFSVPAPAWLLAPLTAGTRVFGNVRQANLFALLMVLGVIAILALAQFRERANAAYPALAAFLGFSVALSLSRTGAVMLWALLIVAWAGKALGRTPRLAMLAAVLAHGAGWGLLQLLEHSELHSYTVLDTVQFVPGGGNFTSNRSVIWSGMLRLVADHALFGVGVGNAGYAYFMTDLPVRFDLNMQHAHNLPLQIAVEHGAILALLWLLMLGVLAWRLRSGWANPACRILMLALLSFGIHSNLEYPLWFLYFLLPCAFALGALVALSDEAPQGQSTAAGGLAERPAAKQVAIAGVCAALLLLAVLLDYQRIMPTFRSTSRDAALANLERGYGTFLFTYQMDYAVVSNVAVTPENARKHYNLTKRLSRVLIQPSTLISLSLASAMLGKTDEAAFYLQRIQEMSGTGIQQVWNTLSSEERSVLHPALQKLGAVVR